MNDLDAQLLDVIQTSVPLVAQPWRLVAEELNLEETEVLHRAWSLQETGVIRRIGGVFEAGRLGYRQTLLALSVEPESLDHSAAVVAGHPGVSHCYSRSDEFNLWATLAVSPDSTLGLETTVQKLAEITGAKAVLNLPASRRFKLAVRFGVKRSAECEVRSAVNDIAKAIPLSDEQKRAVRALQIDLPLESQPFDALASAEDFASGEKLLVHAADLLAAGVLRRYAAVVHHVAAGAKANVMVVWQVPDEKAQFAGEIAAKHQAVSHCYLRETAPGWPFNLYTMIHGPSRENCYRVIHSIASELKNPPRRDLWTNHEYKKSPVKFFSDTENEWEQNTIAD